MLAYLNHLLTCICIHIHALIDARMHTYLLAYKHATTLKRLLGWLVCLILWLFCFGRVFDAAQPSLRLQHNDYDFLICDGP